MIKIMGVAKDAGGAEILGALYEKYAGDYAWEFYWEGAAAHLPHLPRAFRQNPSSGISVSVASRILHASGPDLLLTGTSDQAQGVTPEILFLEAARKMRLPSAAYLDDWTGYFKRFRPLNHPEVFPDYFAVGDRHAHEILKEEIKRPENRFFEEGKILRCENPFWDLFRPAGVSIESSDQAGLLKILYLAKKNPDKDKRLFEVLLKSVLTPTKNALILRVRKHPDGGFSNWQNQKRVLEKRGCRLEASQADLKEDIQWADVVVGSNKPLVAALFAGKKSVALNDADYRFEGFEEIFKTQDGEVDCFQKILKMSCPKSSFVSEQAPWNAENRFPEIIDQILNAIGSRP